MSTKTSGSPLAVLLQQAADLHRVLKEEEKARLERWKDELPSLESLIQGLTQTRDLLKKEKKKIQDEMNVMKATHDRRTMTGFRASKRFGDLHIDVVDLQKKLIDMNNRVLDVNLELEGLRKQLDGIIRDEERMLFEAKFVVLQDTKRILQDEINEIREEIFRRENQAKFEEERKAAESSGWADLNRLEEQLARLEGRIDRAKQGLYFPQVKGYRFSGGSSGVYAAAKDLYVAELSGRFLVSCEKLFKADGSAIAKLSVVLGGASFDDFDSRGGSDGPRARKSRQHQQYAAPRNHAPRRPTPSEPPSPPPGADGQPPSPFMDATQRPPTGAPGLSRTSVDRGPGAEPGGEADQPGSSGGLPPLAPGSGASQGAGPGSEGAGPDVLRGAPSVVKHSSSEPDFFDFQAVLPAVSTGAGPSGRPSPRRTEEDPSELEQIRKAKSKKGTLVMKFLEGLGKNASIKATKDAEKQSKRGGAFWQRKAQQTNGPARTISQKLGAQHKVVQPRRTDPMDAALALQEDDDLAPASGSPHSSVGSPGPASSLADGPEAGPMPSSSSFGSMAGMASFRREDGSEVTSNSGDGMAVADLNDVDAVLGGHEFAAPEQARKGVHLTLLGHGVEVVGERGTKVPNIIVREIAIEVEAVMSAAFTYDNVLGWEAPDKLAFEVSHLDRKVSGNNIPLPRALIQAIINYAMPSVIRKLFLASLPLELGKYVLESGEAFHISGEIRMIGPALTLLTTDLALPSEGAAPRAKTPQDVLTAQRARAQIGLSEQQALVLSELCSGRSCLMETPRPLTLNELCRLYLQFWNTKHWQRVLAMWGRAVQVLGEAHGMSEAWFLSFLTGPVAQLARKPLRVSLSLDRLDAGVDADVGLDALREYCERTVREYQKTIGGSDVFRETLDRQLGELADWHQVTCSMLRSFKSKFRSAGLTMLVAADSEMFQFGAERVHYEGPLKYQLSYPNQVDSDGNAVFDIKLPDPRDAMKSSMLRIQTILEQLTAASLSATGGPDDAAMDKLPPELRNLIERWQDRVATAAAAERRAAADKEGGAGRPDGGAEREEAARRTLSAAEAAALEIPVLSDSTIGRVLLRRLTAVLKLDEKRMAELVSESIGASLRSRDPGAMVAGLMAACGPLLALDVDSEARQYGSEEEQRPHLLFQIASNDVTRVHAQLESVLFQSVVSPKIAIKLLHAVVVGVAQQFHELESRQVRWLDRLFRALTDFLSRDVLDTLLCLSLKALVEEGRLRVLFGGQAAAHDGLTGAAAAATTTPPLYFMNDINLLTIMDNVQSFMDTT